MVDSDALKKHQTKVPPAPPHDDEHAPRKGHGWIWAVVLVLLIGGAIYFYRAKSRAQAAAAAKQTGPPATSVSVTSVQTRDVPFFITGLGSVTAFNTVTVKSRVDGHLMRVIFKEGQFVRAGDVLAEIDARPFQVALDQAQGQ